MQHGARVDIPYPPPVSILIRPKGRMQLPSGYPSGRAYVPFQSSSDPKAGCNGGRLPPILGEIEFQSSSDPKAGCNLSSLWDRRAPLNVSILIRPKGRMQLAQRERRRFHRARFNPHPTQRPDATLSDSYHFDLLFRFQSSSDPKAGCNFPCRRCRATSVQFQSSSDPKAGCNAPTLSFHLFALSCFNPHPTQRPDATYRGAWTSARRCSFQSSSDPKAGCNSPSHRIERR